MIRPFIHPDVNIAENIDDIAVGEIEIDRKCRDDSTAIFIGLQLLFTTEQLHGKLFDLLDKEMPQDTNQDIGCLRMEQWRVLVMAVFKQGMDIHMYSLHNYINHHELVRNFLGYGRTHPKLDLQQVIDNVSMLSLESLAQVGEIVAQAKLDVTRKKPWRLIRKAV